MSRKRYERQVHEIILRESDEREDRPRFLHLVPIGEVLGIAVTRSPKDGDERPPQVKDEDLIFVDMAAFVSALPGLGLVASPAVGIGVEMAVKDAGPQG